MSKALTLLEESAFLYVGDIIVAADVALSTLTTTYKKYSQNKDNIT